MRKDMRHEAVAELAERILAVAKATYETAPKLILEGSQVSPPPIEWHAAYSGAQFAETMLRLCVLRKAQVDFLKAGAKDSECPPNFPAILQQCEREANRMLTAFNVQLAQEL